MRPMSRHFVEIDGVDVSDEMIAIAKQRLNDLPNAHPHHNDGASLSRFPDETFEFVYSYAVFQHIPSREVVVQYLRETHRVMKTGGLARLQFNGLPQGGGTPYDTWAGARFSSSEVMEFARENDFQVLALEGVGTQYMWTSWRKQPRGWSFAQEDRVAGHQAAHSPHHQRRQFGTGGAVARPLGVDLDLGRKSSARRGPSALEVTVGSSFGTITYIGPPDNIGLQQLNVILPELEETGLLPVEVQWFGQCISPPAYCG